MHFETIKRDEILPIIDQAKDSEEQKDILCDLLDCSKKELNALVKELRAERDSTTAKESTSGESAHMDVRNKRWTPEDLEKLSKLHKSGKTSKEIAAELGRSTTAVINKLRQLGVSDRSEQDALVRAVATNDELAEIAAYAGELEGLINKKDAEILTLQSALDASSAEKDRYNEELEAAWKTADEKEKALSVTEERLKSLRELLMKYDRKQTVLSSALAKSLEFIASMNAIIGEVLKA